MSCPCQAPPLDLAGQLGEDMLRSAFVKQTAWAGVSGAALGFMRFGPISAGTLVGVGMYILARSQQKSTAAASEGEVVPDLPIGQFLWMASVAAASALLERMVIGDVGPV